MEEALDKIESMLKGMKRANINIIYSWFRQIDNKELIKAIGGIY